MNLRASLCLFVLTALLATANATERFVRVDGSDDNDGLSRETAFASVQRGVDALEPGDTLTIGPGEYREAISRQNLGNAEAETVIRAEIPGTALLRGDVPAPEFEPVDGYRYVHRARFGRPVQAVNEVDTLQILQARPNVSDVEFNPGTFHYDAESETLYISASDMRSPSEHRYTVSTMESRGGMFLQRPERVVLEGLAVTGFHSSVPFPRLSGGDSQSDVIPWGVYVWLGKDCVVRDTVTYLNAGGIGVISRDLGGNLVERCTSYGNFSQFAVGTANIFGNRVNHDVFRDNYAYTGQDHGIRFHGGGEDSAGRMERNMSWGHHGADIQIKGVSNYDLTHSVVLGAIVGRSRRSLMRSGDDHPTNIVLGGLTDLEREFADPANLDFRLQATSRFRGAGPEGTDQGPFPYEENIYYVSPDGDDRADGLSTESAWASLARAVRRIGPGDTLYIEEGVYTGDLRVSAGADNPGEPLRIRGRGEGRAAIRGNVLIEDAANVEFERLDFHGAVAARGGKAVRFHNARFLLRGGAALRAQDTEGLRVTQCEFPAPVSPAVEMSRCSDVFLRGNLFGARGPAVRADSAGAELYSDYNSFAQEDAAWSVAGSDWGLPRLRQAGLERYSRVGGPEYAAWPAEGGPVLANPEAFALGGPLGRTFGVHRERQLYGGERALRVDGPIFHSVSATTANIEWWSSHPAIFRVRWGRTPEMENSETLTPDNAYHPSNPLENFNTFSLNGLEPGARYYVEIEFAGFVEGDRTADTSDLGELALSFDTLDADPPPRTLYVASDGDDGASGLTRADAWRTINRAADQARPGDTVLIGEGVYQEKVRVRVTGDEDRRIAFKAHPGEKVVLDGHNRTLQGAFWLFNNKDYIDIDGLYLTDFMRGGPGSIRYGAIGVLRCRNIRLTRLFHYQSRPEIITIASSEDVLVQNCVTIGGWDGIAVGGSTNVRIENNVIVRPSIRSVPVSVADREDVLVRNNIITDNIRSKIGANLVPGRLTLEGNCFFLRAPEEERSVFGGRADGPAIDAYNREHGVAKPNLVANPRFAGLVGDEDLGDAQHFADGMIGRFGDFPDLFATHPDLVERGIGLDPEAFAGFHFAE